MLLHWIWFATLPGVNIRLKHQLLERFSDPEELFRTENFSHEPQISQELAESLKNKDLTLARRIMTDCKQAQLSILTMRDAAYPSRLRCICDDPLRGPLPREDWRCSLRRPLSSLLCHFLLF